MAGFGAGLVGLLILLGLAALVETSRDPDRTTARLALGFGALIIVSLAVFIARGDLFRASGMDDSTVEGCGWERAC